MILVLLILLVAGCTAQHVRREQHHQQPLPHYVYIKDEFFGSPGHQLGAMDTSFGDYHGSIPRPQENGNIWQYGRRPLQPSPSHVVPRHNHHLPVKESINEPLVTAAPYRFDDVLPPNIFKIPVYPKIDAKKHHTNP
ncbi:hypothetical protein RB195_021667 [Necator americanus]|uniref:Uncharacterized protein n=1 Tax=Necator americanus TaxID=51031 RepID=A0ABR1EC64_NECAM